MPYKTELRGQVFSYLIEDTLAQNEVYRIRPEQDSTYPNARKYLPFTVVKIINNSDELLKVTVNEKYVFYVSSTTIPIWNQSPIRSVDVQNVSATTTAANEIAVEFQSEDVTTDELSRAVARNSFIKKFLGLEGRVVR